MIKLTEYANINTSEIEIAGKSYYYDDSLYNTGSLLVWSIRRNEPETVERIEYVFSLCEHIFKISTVYFVSPNFIFIQGENSGLDFKIFFTNKKITKIIDSRLWSLSSVPASSLKVIPLINSLAFAIVSLSSLYVILVFIYRVLISFYTFIIPYIF